MRAIVARAHFSPPLFLQAVASPLGPCSTVLLNTLFLLQHNVLTPTLNQLGGPNEQVGAMCDANPPWF